MDRRDAAPAIERRDTVIECRDAAFVTVSPRPTAISTTCVRVDTVAHTTANVHRKQ